MTEKERPQKEPPPKQPEPPPFDPDPDLVTEIERGWKPEKPSKSR